MFRTNNPVLSSGAFAQTQTWDSFNGGPLAGRGGGAQAVARPATMTVAGTVNSALILLGITIAAATGGWMWLTVNPAMILPVWIGTTLLGFVAFFAVRSLPKFAAPLSMVFAAFEGLFVGAISVVYANYWGNNPAGPGIVFQAVVITFGAMGALLLAYKSGLIRATPVFKRVVIVASGAIFFLFISQFVLSLVFKFEIPVIWRANPIGIGIAAFVVVIAALNLVLDFDYIEQGAANNLPKSHEWIGAFGLLVTLVWLYVSVLRLLALIREYTR